MLPRRRKQLKLGRRTEPLREGIEEEDASTGTTTTDAATRRHAYLDGKEETNRLLGLRLDIRKGNG